MSISAKNVGTQHLPRVARQNKNKNFFELTDKIPRKVFYDDQHHFEWNVCYAELLIKVLEKHDILDKIEVDFLESDTIEYLLYILEYHVQLIDNHITYNVLKNNIDSVDDNWEKPISIYHESNKNGKLKSISLGIPDIEPDFIYAFFIKDISLFKSRQMRIGYAYFLKCFEKLTFTTLTENEIDYYISLNQQIEIYEDFEHEDDDSWIHELKAIEKKIEKRKPIAQKVFTKFNDYLSQEYSEFLNYKPRNPEIKEVYDAILFCIETLDESFYSKFCFSNFGLDSGAIDFQRLFRIFLEDNETTSFEFDQINHESQEGVVPLESILKITKSKIHYDKRKADQYLFKKFTEKMAIISQYLYNQKDGKNRK